MTTGWQQIEGQWYHMDSTGAMETGWFKDSDSGKWYYLYPSGVMAVNTVIDGRTIGTDGVWVPEEGAVEPLTALICLPSSWFKIWKEFPQRDIRSSHRPEPEAGSAGIMDGPAEGKRKPCNLQYQRRISAFIRFLRPIVFSV